MALVLRWTAIFVFVIILWALLAAAMAHAQQPQLTVAPHVQKADLVQPE